MGKFSKTGLVIFVIGVLTTGISYAATDPDFSQTINPGTLTVDILDETETPVANPGVSMSAVSSSTSCQTPGSSGTFGTNTERIYVDNPDGANNGWTLDIAATSGPTATWSSGSGNFDYNDITSSGCTDGADTDSEAGQMSIDPSVGTITLDCDTCSATGVTTSSSATFDEGTVDSIELMNASSSSDDIWRGYLTGVDVEQTIPAETPADTYTINLTVSVTAS